jgi:hypothetical protein
VLNPAMLHSTPRVWRRTDIDYAQRAVKVASEDPGAVNLVTNLARGDRHNDNGKSECRRSRNHYVMPALPGEHRGYGRQGDQHLEIAAENQRRKDTAGEGSQSAAECNENVERR